ncbi:Eukaryotic translation initiation factor 3 subunit M [Balamuthia mandrillaris]
MTTLVELASREQEAQELVKYFNKLQQDKSEESTEESAFVKDCNELIKAENYKDLINKLSDLQPLVFEKAPEKEIEGCLNLLCCLLRQLDTQSAEAVVAKLIDAITTTPNDRPLLRLRLLNNLFNLLHPQSSARYAAFTSLAKFAAQSGNAHLLFPHLERLDSWLSLWNSTTQQKRDLYLLLRNIIKENSNKTVMAHKYLIKHLATYEEESSSALEAATEQAVVAAVEAIRLPEIIQCDDLLKLAAVKQLESSNPNLYKLLSLFAHDTLDAFQKFHDAHPNFLGSDCIKKMRLLSLASLAAEQREVPYSSIAEMLSISAEEVESWIILAIRNKIIDAKMDQLRSVAIINQATQREFAEAQWQQVADRLAAWRERMVSLLEVVQSKKA